MRKLIFLTLSLVMISALSSCRRAAPGGRFVMATYNLRYDNAGDSLAGNGWLGRLPHIADLIRFHEFEIFGTQEGKFHQLEGLKAALPGFEYIGSGREDGVHKGEHAAIFFDAGKFELLDHGDFWLSQTPEVAGSKGWDAALPRVCTWGKFRHRESGFVFLYYNLHMDHVGVQARSESARLILRKIQENPEKLPAILSGDFNISQENEAFKLLDRSGTLNDAWRITDLRYINSCTFNGFQVDRYRDMERIDHIFLTDGFSVEKYGVLTDTYRSLSVKETGEEAYVARVPSDHYPVMIRVRFGE